MASFQESKWFIVVEAMPVMDGKTIKRLRPDENGYYDVPLLTLGVPTRNNVYYIPESIKKCIESPTSGFNIMLRDGCLKGCIDHPEAYDRDDIPKLLDIREQFVSHFIKKVYTGEVLPNGGQLLMGKLKPFGAYGPNLEQSLQDPDVNTAFSIRSLCKEHTDPTTKQKIRDVQILVTFDFVSAPGYREACKRFAPATESYKIPVTINDFYRDGKIACESFTDQELLRIFDLEDITIGSHQGKHQKGSKFYMQNGNKKSIAHAFITK